MRKWGDATLKNIEMIRPDKQLQELARKKNGHGQLSNPYNQSYSGNKTPTVNLPLEHIMMWPACCV